MAVGGGQEFLWNPQGLSCLKFKIWIQLRDALGWLILNPPQLLLFHSSHLLRNLPNSNEDVRFLPVLGALHTDLTPFKALLGLLLSVTCEQTGAPAEESEQEQERLTNSKTQESWRSLKRSLMEI